MANLSRMTNWKTAGAAFDQRALMRLGKWGTAAAGALLVAALSVHYSSGSQRSMVSTAAAGTEGAVLFQVGPIIAQVAARSEELESETRRLSEALAALFAEREQLALRLGALEPRLVSLERNLADVTGSIKRPPAPAPSSSSATAPLPLAMSTLLAPTPLATRDQITPNMETTKSGPAPLDLTVARRSGGAAAAESPDTETSRGKAEFGVDVGGASSFDGLRGLWNATRAADAALFDGLVPLVIARESKSRGTDLRLIVGPLPDGDAATRLCVALSVARRYCQPTAFEGQELSLSVAEREPERRPAASSQQRKTTSANQRPPQARPKS